LRLCFAVVGFKCPVLVLFVVLPGWSSWPLFFFNIGVSSPDHSFQKKVTFYRLKFHTCMDGSSLNTRVPGSRRQTNFFTRQMACKILLYRISIEHDGGACISVGGAG
jgi:hypothetical protein